MLHGDKVCFMEVQYNLLSGTAIESIEESVSSSGTGEADISASFKLTQIRQQSK